LRLHGATSPINNTLLVITISVATAAYCPLSDGIVRIREKPMAKSTRKKSVPRKSAPRPDAKKSAKKSARKPAARDEQAQMEAWQRTMTPGAGHARLEPMVGTWIAKTTTVMGPGATPMVSEGVSDHRLILDGRYLEQHYRGSAMGMPFEGR